VNWRLLGAASVFFVMLSKRCFTVRGISPCIKSCRSEEQVSASDTAVVALETRVSEGAPDLVNTISCDGPPQLSLLAWLLLHGTADKVENGGRPCGFLFSTIGLIFKWYSRFARPGLQSIALLKKNVPHGCQHIEEACLPMKFAC